MFDFGSPNYCKHCLKLGRLQHVGVLFDGTTEKKEVDGKTITCCTFCGNELKLFDELKMADILVVLWIYVGLTDQEKLLEAVNAYLAMAEKAAEEAQE